MKIGWGIILILIMVLTVLEMNIRDYKLLRNKGKLLYAIKGRDKDLYFLLGVCVFWLIILGDDYIRRKEAYQLGYIVFWIVFLVSILLRMGRKHGFYEHALIIENGCYDAKSIRSYHWNKYILKEEADPLMLEVPCWKIFKGHQTTFVEIAVPKEDIQKVEIILDTYGIEKRSIGNNTLNVKS